MWQWRSLISYNFSHEFFMFSILIDITSIKLSYILLKKSVSLFLFLFLAVKSIVLQSIKFKTFAYYRLELLLSFLFFTILLIFYKIICMVYFVTNWLYFLLFYNWKWIFIFVTLLIALNLHCFILVFFLFWMLFLFHYILIFFLLNFNFYSLFQCLFW